MAKISICWRLSTICICLMSLVLRKWNWLCLSQGPMSIVQPWVTKGLECTYLASSRRYGCADFFASYPYVMNASKPHSLGSFCNSFLSEGKRRVIETHFCQKMHSLSLLYQSMRPWCLSIPEHMWFAVPTYKMCVFVFLFSASGSPYMCVRSAMWNFLYAAFFSLIMWGVREFDGGRG